MPENKQTILCVDDEYSILTIRKIVLESNGYQVLTAENGRKGLDIFAAEQIDAVLLDYRMPGMNGGEVAQEIRRSKPLIPLIMVSAANEIPEDAKNFIDAFVEKGKSPGQLLELLDSMLKVRSHKHPELGGDYVVFVNDQRRYIEATDGACDLLGYARPELLGMRIEDVSVPGSERVVEMFEKYLEDGLMEGEFVLRHRMGSHIPIHFWSKAYKDGCLAASWTPLAASLQQKKRASY
ncbi:MAG: response regulator receiver protein [Acidobacteriales bacterium]|nr:response regulator receiver protein [Terriglobales bacterium]